MKLHLEQRHTLTSPCEKEHVYLCALASCSKPFITSDAVFLRPVGGQWGGDRYPYWPFCSRDCAGSTPTRDFLAKREAMYDPSELESWPGPIYFDINTYKPPTIDTPTSIVDILLPGRGK